MALPRCPRCREIDWHAHHGHGRPHVCAPVYHVCPAGYLDDAPSDDDVRDHGRRLHATGAGAAAERYAALSEAEDFDHHPDEHEVWVVAAGSDDVERWTVEARTERTYHASRPDGAGVGPA